MVGDTLGDFNLDTVRHHLSKLQSCKKWQDHPSTPTKDQYLSPTIVRNHARVLTSFARWLFNEEYTTENVLTRLKVPKANEICMEPLSDDEITRLMAEGSWIFESNVPPQNLAKRFSAQPGREFLLMEKEL
jgi:site-specific recombinase XerD